MPITPTKELPKPAQVVLSCTELQATMDFLVERAGFRLDRISPADDPCLADMSGHGLHLQLRRDAGPNAELLVIPTCEEGALPAALVAPNGTRIEFVRTEPSLRIPPVHQEFVVSRADDASAWVTGRAGMQYRDLIPGRQGGRFVASNIRILKGGVVADNVHFHAIRFQMIYCTKGWVRLVYQDQGPEFVLQAGDCVLQPALIRHRVLESSDGLEVVEIACPAEHDTFLDHDLALPTAHLDRERDFDGQTFVRHEAADAQWRPWTQAGFEFRDLGIEEGTRGLAQAVVLRNLPEYEQTIPWSHAGEFLFTYILEGSCHLAGHPGGPITLGKGDSVTLPAGMECSLEARSGDLQILELRLP